MAEHAAAAAPPLPATRVVEALGVPGVAGGAEAFRGVSLDSRALRPGSLFVALRGERHDGNDFTADAVAAGAAGIVAERPPPAGHPAAVAWWQVEDGAAALRRLAVVHRAAMPARVVCVTGSNGKTGTKELVADVLGAAALTARTPGNLNSLIGLPLALLELAPEHEWGVFEIGTSRPGEIAQLAAMARPDVGVITNASASHLEGLGSLEAVVREKTDLAAALGRSGTLVYGGDGELLRAAVHAFSCAAVSFGLDERNDVHPESWALDEEGRPVFRTPELGEVRLRLFGVASLLNALAAVAVGRLAGVAPRAVREALEAAAPLPLRLEVLRAAGVTVIRDCYNANPESVARGVETLRAMGHGGPRVAVLGAMRELGAEAEALHYALGRELGRRPLDLLLVYGDEALALARGYQSVSGAPVHLFRDPAALARFLRERIDAPATVLFKASRGVALEEAVRAYLAELADGRGEAPRPDTGNGNGRTAGG